MNNEGNNMYMQKHFKRRFQSYTINISTLQLIVTLRPITRSSRMRVTTIQKVWTFVDGQVNSLKFTFVEANRLDEG